MGSETDGQALLSELEAKYAGRYGASICEGFGVTNTLKVLVQMDKLLLLNRYNCDDVQVVFCNEKAPKLVVTICKQFPDGIKLSKFRKILGEKLSVSLTGCNIIDF